MARRTQKTLNWPTGVKRPSWPPPLLPVETAGINTAVLMTSREPKDQAYLGKMMEELLKSPTGEMICRIIHGLKARASRTAESAECRIGRIQQLEELLDVFEAYVVNLKSIRLQESEAREAEVWDQVMTRTGQAPPSSSGAGEAD